MRWGILVNYMYTLKRNITLFKLCIVYCAQKTNGNLIRKHRFGLSGVLKFSQMCELIVLFHRSAGLHFFNVGVVLWLTSGLCSSGRWWPNIKDYPVWSNVLLDNVANLTTFLLGIRKLWKLQKIYIYILSFAQFYN